jgi:phosphomevalonate kinase
VSRAPRRFFAPGKVVVAGEYAVVDGAPAIVAAVGLGVAVDVVPGAERGIRTPDGDARFVAPALDAAGAPTGTFTFVASGGPDLPSKPGLGGSAAATVVAVHAARVLSGGDASADAVRALATEVHHRVQGSGSGIDVAASAHGGVLRFVRGEPPVPLAAPRLVVVWTGASARTGPRVERYLAWPGRDAFVAASAALVDRFAADPLAALRENGRLLVAMADAAGLDYRTPALDRITALAEEHGGAAKPSGAGGGDSAVAILPDPEAEAAFVVACGREGLVVLATEVDRGVREIVD